MSREILRVDNSPELVAIVGPMYSGKSSDLLEQMYIASEVLEVRTVLVKPEIDNRFSDSEVVSHSGRRMSCINVDIANPDQIITNILLAEEDGVPVEVVGIDEGQFFDRAILEVIDEILLHGKKVFVAGLPTDFRDEPFGQMPVVVVKADRVIHKTAKCMYRDPQGKRCGDSASKTQRIVDGIPANYDSPVVMVGAKEAYEARCRVHHIVPNRPRR